MGWRDWTVVGLLAGILALKALLVLGSGGTAAGAGEVQATVSLAETLGGADTVGYARAFEPRAFDFPEDHGPHPDFRTEWWYLTGNLDGPDGRRFGFQFTIFRSALAPPSERASADTSSWSTRQMYLGHFTLTDVEAGTFTEFERFTRGAVGLAGATASDAPGVPALRVWLDDWELESTSSGVRPSDDPAWPLTLTAADSGVALELELDPLKPVVLQGDRGLSQKGPEPGNASYYYTFPRLAASGRVVSAGDTIPVTGRAWLDREWSTSALGEGQQGWDWFSLQLSDGSELMVYQIREADGAASAESEGVWIAPDGATTRLAATDYTLTPTDTWASPVDGSPYPSGWRIEVPSLDLEVGVEPVLRDQELNVTFRYWEGAVDLAGSRRGQAVTGRGYVELTGYAGEPAARGS